MSVNLANNIATLNISGHEVIVDLEDYEKVNDDIWIINNGRPVRYWSENYKCYTEPLYKTIIDVPEGLTVDYKNGNVLDLRKENLRVCTMSEKHRHYTKLPKNNTTGKVGVSRHKGGGFIASITLDSEYTDTGKKERMMVLCPTLGFAIALRETLEMVFYGEFAPTV